MRDGKGDWRNAQLGAFIGEGWVPIVDEWYAEAKKIDPEIEIGQVKEKFGGLRIYYDSDAENAIRHLWEEENPQPEAAYGTPEYTAWNRAYWDAQPIHVLLSEAEERCSQTCEDCGAPGVLRKGGWLRTLCNEHAEGCDPLTEDE